MKQFDATDLLEKGIDPGYPSDYLLSRIRGRKARLIQDWTPLVTSPAPLERLPESHYQRISGDRSRRGHLESATERIPLGVLSDEQPFEKHFCALLCIR